jgi:hypothetical protein
MTIISLNENGECQMLPYHSPLVMSNNINENLIVFATCNVVHKWLDMWCFCSTWIMTIWYYSQKMYMC